jgi:hypothetical protein
MSTTSEPTFQDAFNYTVARMTKTLSLRESFDSFNPIIGRKIASTPPAPPPVSAMEYQRSPIVEPMSPPDRFTNVPPYARVGSTHEDQHGRLPSTQYHSAGPNQDPSDSSSSSSGSSSISSAGQGRASYPSDDDTDPSKIRAYLFST